MASKARARVEAQLSIFGGTSPDEASPSDALTGTPVDEASPSDALTATLREVFGHPNFRPGQRRAIEAVNAGRDAVVLLPTGSGKSLCFQVPAVAMARAGRGCTVVVSPLLALMHDQVRALTALGVRAEALNSTRSPAEQREVVQAFEAGELELLYVSPERAAQRRFRTSLAQADVALLAIDEAHCVSQWGHDFRPEYMRLHELRARVDCPVIALTATATRRVLGELSSGLALVDPVHIEGGFARPNLGFEVHHAATDAARLGILEDALAQTPSGRVIIYCATRKKTQRVCQALTQAGASAGYYHAGRTALARQRAEAAFASGKRRILVATNAFGMGVDFPDVRLLVHFQTPGSVEAYYQEAGRAGRDGLPSRCLLFFGAADLRTQRRLAIPRRCTARQRARVESALEAVVAYAHADSCRQRAMSLYFGAAEAGEVPNCERCDCCRGEASRPAHSRPNSPAPAAIPEGLEDAVMAALEGLPKAVGRLDLARMLGGSKAKSVRKLGLQKASCYASFDGHTQAELLATLDALRRAGRLVQRGRKYPKLWLAGRTLPGSKARAGRGSGSSSSSSSSSPGSELARGLENYRRRVARRRGCKPFMIFHRKVILAVARQRPETLAQLALIPGLGVVKVDEFGDDILDLVRRAQA